MKRFGICFGLVCLLLALCAASALADGCGVQFLDHNGEAFSCANEIVSYTITDDTHTKNVRHCSADGAHYFEMNDCSPAEEHHYYYQYGDKVIEATCTSPAILIKHYYCTGCGKEKLVEETDPTSTSLGHSYGSWEVSVAPTCVAPGTDVRTCSLCGATQSNGTIPPNPLNHTWSKWRTVEEPTCQTEGMKERNCLLCDASETVSTGCVPHDFALPALSTSDDQDACKPAIYETRSCRWCPEYIVVRDEPAVDHNFSMYAEKRPTCQEEGWQKFECMNDGCNATTTVPVEKVPHDYSLDASTYDYNPKTDCKGSVYATSMCRWCPAYIVTRDEPAVPHNFSMYAEKLATCQEEGWQKFECMNEGCQATRTDTLEKVKHDYSLDAISSDYDPKTDCEPSIYETSMCRWCPEFIVIRDEPAKKHEFSAFTAAQPASCTKGGTEQAMCKSCGYIAVRETPRLGHSYTDSDIVYGKLNATSLGMDFVTLDFTYFDPTYCAPSRTSYQVCSRCHDHKLISETPALPHNWSRWIFYPSGDSINDGLKIRFCYNCLIAEYEFTDPDIAFVYEGHEGHDVQYWDGRVCSDLNLPIGAIIYCKTCDEYLEDGTGNEYPDLFDDSPAPITCAYCGSPMREWISSGFGTHYRLCINKACGKKVEQFCEYSNVVINGEIHYLCTICHDCDEGYFVEDRDIRCSNTAYKVHLYVKDKAYGSKKCVVNGYSDDIVTVERTFSITREDEGASAIWEHPATVMIAAPQDPEARLICVTDYGTVQEITYVVRSGKMIFTCEGEGIYMLVK